MGATGSKPAGNSGVGRGRSGMGGGKPSGGGGQTPFSSGAQAYQGGGNFWDFNPRSVAGLNQFQQGAGAIAGGLGQAGQGNLRQAGNLLNQLGGGGSGYTQQGINAANRYAGGNLPGQFGEAQQLNQQMLQTGQKQVTGANIQSDPAYQAAQKAFAQSQLPLIQNQAARAGLGRSSAMTNAIAHGNAQAMLPMIQDALGREERGIGRQLSSQQQGIGNLMNAGQQVLGQNAQGAQSYFTGAGQEAARLGQAAGGLAQLAGQEFSQGANQANLMSNLGQQYRGVEQQQLDAPYQEQQRLWGEALNSMYGPLGFLGNMGGATSTQSKK